MAESVEQSSSFPHPKDTLAQRWAERLQTEKKDGPQVVGELIGGGEEGDLDRKRSRIYMVSSGQMKQLEQMSGHQAPEGTWNNFYTAYSFLSIRFFIT